MAADHQRTRAPTNDECSVAIESHRPLVGPREYTGVAEMRPRLEYDIGLVREVREPFPVRRRIGVREKSRLGHGHTRCAVRFVEPRAHQRSDSDEESAKSTAPRR